MEHVWLQQQKQIYRLRNVRTGYVLYKALVFIVLSIIYQCHLNIRCAHSTLNFCPV